MSIFAFIMHSPGKSYVRDILVMWNLEKKTNLGNTVHHFCLFWAKSSFMKVSQSFLAQTVRCLILYCNDMSPFCKRKCIIIIDSP